VTAVGPFAILHVRVRCRSLKFNNHRRRKQRERLPPRLCLGVEMIFIQCLYAELVSADFMCIVHYNLELTRMLPPKP
jgi:hypothetical protein